MKILWLNDSLVLRGETKQEKSALAVIYDGLEPKENGQISIGELDSNHLNTAELVD